MMHRDVVLRALAFVAAAFSFSACSAHEEKTAERTVSPLIGTWTRDGNVTKDSGTNGPQFTKLSFAANGKLSASYVSGGVGALLGTAPSVKMENDTYATPGDDKLSIAEGTTHLGFTYRVSDAKLYLTPLGGGDAAVFSKSD